MMQTIEGIYHNGRVELLETPPPIHQARVMVTFLNDPHTLADKRRSVVNLGEILTDDLAGASQEIAATFNQALAQSALEFREC